MKSCLAFLLLFSISTNLKAQDGRFAAMLNSYYQDYLVLNPTVATAVGDYRFNDRLENPISATHRAATSKLAARYLDSLKQYPDKTLTPRDRLSKKIFAYDLNRIQDGSKFKTWLTPIHQFNDFRLSF